MLSHTNCGSKGGNRALSSLSSVVVSSPCLLICRHCSCRLRLHHCCCCCCRCRSAATLPPPPPPCYRLCHTAGAVVVLLLSLVHCPSICCCAAATATATANAAALALPLLPCFCLRYHCAAVLPQRCRHCRRCCKFVAPLG